MCVCACVYIYFKMAIIQSMKKAEEEITKYIISKRHHFFCAYLINRCRGEQSVNFQIIYVNLTSWFLSKATVAYISIFYFYCQ